MYCIKCGKEVPEGVSPCPDCGEPIYHQLSELQIKELSLTAHRRENEGYDKQQNALCFLVIGIMLLIIGVIFFVLSFKITVGSASNARTLKYTSFEFMVSVVGLAVGSFLTIFGSVRLAIALKLKRGMHTIIEKLRAGGIHQ